MLLCFLEDELNSVQLARETTDDDAALGPLIHHFAHAVLDVVLTVGVSASALAVGRFVHHEEEALGVRNILQALEVELAAIHRVLLDTPVTTTENVPYWCTHHYCGRIRNGAVHPHQLHTKGVTQLDDLMLLRLELMILWLVAAIGLCHGALQHTQGKGCAIDWGRQLGDDVPKGTDMVEVPVGKDVCPNLVLILL